MVFYYILKDIAHWVLKGHVNKHSDVYRGYKLYKQTDKGKRKSLIKVVHELNVLSSYWKAFPDVYFRFGMFLKSYSDLNRMKSFVPQNAYYRYSFDKDARYHILIDDKILFHDLMTQYGLPVPTRYFTFRNGIFRDGNNLLTDQDVNAILAGIDDERIFVKRFTGGAASGVSIFTRASKGQYIDVDQEIVNAKMIRKKYKGQDFFFEKQLIQEPILSSFNPDTVNTIRVLTYKDKVISAAVRFGGKGSFVDNTAKGGGSG